MALVKRKTRRAIRKQVTRAIAQHGPEIITGIATGLLSSLATLVTAHEVSGDKPAKKGKGSGKKSSTAGKIVESLVKIPAVQEAAKLLPNLSRTTATKGKRAKKKPAAGAAETPEK